MQFSTSMETSPHYYHQTTGSPRSIEKLRAQALRRNHTRTATWVQPTIQFLYKLRTKEKQVHRLASSSTRININAQNYAGSLKKTTMYRRRESEECYDSKFCFHGSPNKVIVLATCSYQVGIVTKYCRRRHMRNVNELPIDPTFKDCDINLKTPMRPNRIILFIMSAMKHWKALYVHIRHSRWKSLPRRPSSWSNTAPLTVGHSNPD